MNKKKRSAIIELILAVGILLVLNVLGYYYYKRFDLTKEKRYSISDTTKKLVADLPDVVYFRIYLEGDLPPVFKKLSRSVKDMLYEMRLYSDEKIEFEIINPSDNPNQKTTNEVYQQLLEKGLEPKDLQIKKSDGLNRQTIWPGAIIAYRNEEIPINFLEGQTLSFANFQTMVNEAEETLEFRLANAIKKITTITKPKVAFSQGNGELDGTEVFDFAKTLSEFYQVEPYDLSRIEPIPKDIKVLVVAKPDTAFSDWDKFKIDNYIMQGGNVLWLLDLVKAEMDSMKGGLSFMAIQNQLRLEDQLFRYGIRINPDLIQDLKCASIPINVSGQMEYFPWYYFPLATPNLNHPISKNLDPVRLQFVNTLDTIVKAGIRKSILLTSSKYAKVLPAPVRINLGLIRDIGKPEQFKKSNQNIAVLLEGKFESLYKNRVLNDFAKAATDTMDFKLMDEAEKSSRMVVVSDGDIIRNQISKANEKYYPLGYDKYTNQTYGNKIFLLNAIDYLAGNAELIDLRAKDITLRLLDKQLVLKEKPFWQGFNLVLPLVILILFGVIYIYFRKKKYARIIKN